MEGDDSREPFGFAVDTLRSKNIPTNLKKLPVNALKSMLTPFFITVDIFYPVITY